VPSTLRMPFGAHFGKRIKIICNLTQMAKTLKDRLISRKCDIEWAAHSSDLNPPYFYLWGYLKDNVYENNPQTIGELKTAITANIREILQPMDDLSTKF
jgi:hypothetical protein